MLRSVPHSKLHGATVKAALPDSIGWLTIDADVFDADGLRPKGQATVATRQRNRVERVMRYDHARPNR